MLIAGSFLAAAAGIAAAPFLGGLPGVAGGMAVFGLAIGFDNVVSVTLIQRWAPPAMLGRVWGLLILASTGSFPVSTFIAGLLTRHLGPTPVFPIAGAPAGPFHALRPVPAGIPRLRGRAGRLTAVACWRS